MLEKNDEHKYACLATHLKTLKSVKDILDALNRQGIEAIILKGIYLAIAAYPDLSRQPGSDIDLLVRRGDALKAQTILASLGWREESGVLPALINYNKPLALNSLMFFNPDSLVSVHLHWHIINTTWPLNCYVQNIDMADIWQAALSGSLDGAPVKELKPEHLVIYLCYHGFTHNFAKPVYVDDIKAALSHYKDNINWPFLYGQAQKWGLRWLVEYGIKYIEKPGPGRYSETYWHYFRQEKGINGKILFLYRTFFPNKIIMAAANGLPLDQVGFKHYLNRLQNLRS
jgi:hypothetical protein